MPQAPVDPVFEQLVTAGLTILGGVVVLVLGQLITKFYIEPLHGLIDLRSRIATSMVFFANRFGHADMMPQEEVSETSDTLRRHASELRAFAWTLPWHVLILGAGLRRKDLITASENLIGLSNSMRNVNWQTLDERQKTIMSCLRFA